MNLINPDSPEWAEYMGDALMAEFVKLDILPTMAMPQRVIPMFPDETEGPLLPGSDDLGELE